MNVSNIRVIILAAGVGKRMNSRLPKAMLPVHGQPMLEHVVAAVEQLYHSVGPALATPSILNAGINKPVIVVNNRSTLIQDYFGSRATYVIQTEQLGTGHAVAQTETILKLAAEEVIVLYGDMPFIRSSSLEQLLREHRRSEAVMTLMTAKVPDFENSFAPFMSFARIIRDDQGRITKIVEKKDATENELHIRELNTSYFCFNSRWLWEHLRQLKNNNAQGEYYLTDLLSMAVAEGKPVASMLIAPEEAMGVNSPEDLEIVNAI